MSSRSHQLRLESEVLELRQLIVQLTLRVEELESRVESESQHFELVSSVSQSVSQAAPSLPVASPVVPEVVSSNLGAERETILRGIGIWLRDCLAGKRRGLSGREKLVESSSCYIVVRGYSGKVFNPVKVCRCFAECSVEVKSQGRVGDSIFVGVPSIAEARIIVAASGLLWPSEQSDGCVR